MIVIDSSAILAILEGEPEADVLWDVILRNECKLSAFSRLEISSVILGRRGAGGLPDLELLLQDLGIEIVAFDAATAALAVTAYARWGKGLGRRPHLNLGDCVAYATARQLGAPLLYKGDDFAVSDILPALPA